MLDHMWMHLLIRAFAELLWKSPDVSFLVNMLASGIIPNVSYCLHHFLRTVCHVELSFRRVWTLYAFCAYWHEAFASTKFFALTHCSAFKLKRENPGLHC